MQFKKISLLFLTIVIILSLLIGGCDDQNRTTNVGPGTMSREDNSQVPLHNRNGSQPEKAPPVSDAKKLKVHFIDVGQGDAILVQTPKGQNMLVDAGDNGYGDQVADYLQSQGVTELEVVVGTHPHADHIGGLDTVISKFAVKKIYLPRVTHTSRSFQDLLAAVKAKGLKINTAQAGAAIPLEGIQSRFIAPVNDKYEDLNDYSAVIKIDYGSQSFLLTGDAGGESEKQMLASGVNLKSTVLKVGHHGSHDSTGNRFLKAISPGYAVIMVGADNKYGHPHQETMARLQKTGAQIYRTDVNGTVIFTTDGTNFNIETER